MIRNGFSFLEFVWPPTACSGVSRANSSREFGLEQRFGGGDQKKKKKKEGSAGVSPLWASHSGGHNPILDSDTLETVMDLSGNFPKFPDIAQGPLRPGWCI